MKRTRLFGLFFTGVAVGLLLLNYSSERAARARAKSGQYVESTAPNGEYRIKYFYIFAGEKMVLLFQVFDREGVLIAEHTRKSIPGGAIKDWDCDKGHCTAFAYEIGDTEPIHLPPTWLDRWRAKIP